uniref:Zinc transporter 2 n=1 Tax=Macrostomum lignano TaxID=282301 RepID=A0A1I8I1N3_9PLAT
FSLQIQCQPGDELANSLDFSNSSTRHCHSGETERRFRYIAAQKLARRRLVIAAVACLVFMIGEVIGGAIANSLAIMTDAAHLLTDLTSFLISLLALFLATKRPSRRMSFGWYRAEVIGALVSVLMIWIVTAVLVYMAVHRVVQKDFEVEGEAMLITAGVGVAFNMLMALLLHQGHGHSHGLQRQNCQADGPAAEHGEHDHHHEHIGSSFGHNHAHNNMNVRAAFIHVIGDLLQSIGVLVAALIIYYRPDYKLADPICTFVFSLLVLGTTVSILKDTVRVLLEATPQGIDVAKFRAALAALPCVIQVHSLRVWSLTLGRNVASAHLVVNSNCGVVQRDNLVVKATELSKKIFQMSDVTLQVEPHVLEMDSCEHCRSFTVEDSITIKDYSKARITLLSVGQERTLVCESPISVSANKRKNLQIDWYFGDTDSLTKIIFDSNGWSLSHRTTTNNSSSSAFRILLDDGVYRNRGSIVVKSSNISSFSDKNGLSYNNLLNGILACVYSRSGDISSIFHLMTLLPPLPINRESAAVTQCPPGHAAASYAGLSVCQPCLPNEFSPGGVSPCQPCRAGQFNSRFASPECAKQRLKRSTTAGKATVHLMHRRLPLADFRSVIMYHCLLICFCRRLSWLYY